MLAKFKVGVKDPIVVYCRIRPIENSYEQVCIRIKNDTTVVLCPPETSQTSKLLKEVHYSFKHVFSDEVSQKELFDQVAYPLVQDLLDGSNGLLFTYGITSSGKTYTMTGTPEDCGLLPRSLDVIFNSIRDYQAAKYVFKPDKFNCFEVQSTAEALLDQQKELGMFSRTPKPKRRDNAGESWSGRIPDTSVIDEVSPDMNYAVFVSYVEIYNNYIYDLLEDSLIDPKRTKNLSSKLLREDSTHNMYVFGVAESEVKTVEEALELFYKGQQRRKIANTALNTESSRSHSVFTIRVVQAPLDPQGAEILQDKDQITVSQLSLVDLAGSERPLRTRNTGQKLREAGNINNSLMALRNCIEALRESQNQASSKMVPYRDSKLTHLFKSFFEGEGKIRMIVCVNPRADDYDETTHVLRFSEVTQEIMINRPTPISTTPNVLGLRQGRGNAYREAFKKAKEQGVSVADIINPIIYTLGPDFPQLVIHTTDDEHVFENLLDFLATRNTRRNTFNQDLLRRQEDFRRNLNEVDKESIQLRQEKTILQMDLEARAQQVQSLERKLSSAEQTLEMQQKQINGFHHQVQAVTMQLDSKDRILSEQDREMGNIKIKMQEKLASEKDRMRRVMERRLAAKQAELERKMCFTGERFRQLREILNADDWEFADFVAMPAPPSSVTSTQSSEISVPESRRTRQKSLTETQKLTKAKSAVDFVMGSSRQNLPYSSQQSRNDFDNLYAKENKEPSSSQRLSALLSNKVLSSLSLGKAYLIKKGSRIGSLTGLRNFNRNHSTVSVSSYVLNRKNIINVPYALCKKVKSVAISNLRHRRSQSSSADTWIEHKPIGNLELNTVLQPKMKKKKSVSKLTVKDVTNNDHSKYVLQHQEQDSQGEVETQLYKGDIIPSAGGGAQVVFNDVEKLKQSSPPTMYNLRKRSGESLPLREVEDRCTVSVECHGLPSKMLKKK